MFTAILIASSQPLRPTWSYKECRTDVTTAKLYLKEEWYAEKINVPRGEVVPRAHQVWTIVAYASAVNTNSKSLHYSGILLSVRWDDGATRQTWNFKKCCGKSWKMCILHWKRAIQNCRFNHLVKACCSRSILREFKSGRQVHPWHISRLELRMKTRFGDWSPCTWAFYGSSSYSTALRRAWANWAHA